MAPPNDAREHTHTHTPKHTHPLSVARARALFPFLCLSLALLCSLALSLSLLLSFSSSISFLSPSFALSLYPLPPPPPFLLSHTQSQETGVAPPSDPSGDTIFGKIIRGEIPCDKVYEGAHNDDACMIPISSQGGEYECICICI